MSSQPKHAEPSVNVRVHSEKATEARLAVEAGIRPPSGLYYGDNLDILRRYVKDESVDLIYLDPPFNSNRDYNLLFTERGGAKSAAQIRAFTDTWEWDSAAALAYEELIAAGGKLADGMAAIRQFVGESDMLAYLSMMAPRLVELRRALKHTGSLFLHCDPNASHYLRVLLDAIFGVDNFRNEIVWRRAGSHNGARRFGPIHDTILFYSKSSAFFFKRVHRPYTNGHVANYFKKSDAGGKYWTNSLTGAGTRAGESGQPWRGYDPAKMDRHWAVPGKVVRALEVDESLGVHEKLDALDLAGAIVHPSVGSAALPTYRQYLDSSPGLALQDIWAYQPYTDGLLYGSDEAIDEDVRWMTTQGGSERTGLQTQKPLGLMQRVIDAACPDGGVVLDPFCGCGTTVDAAQRLGRPWIGIDITHLAITLIRSRLQDSYGPGILRAFNVIGEPTTIDDAEELAKSPDKYQFQWWALGLVGARPVEQKKGADGGIDGRLYFNDTGVAGARSKQIIFSVKAGHVTAAHVRDLRGVIEREKAEMGVLLSFEETTKPMEKEALAAGFYQSPLGKHRRMQLLTVRELLSGTKVDYPWQGVANMTYKASQRATSTPAIQSTLV